MFYVWSCSCESDWTITVDKLASVHISCQLTCHDGIILGRYIYKWDNIEMMLTSTAVQGRHMQPAGALVTS